MKINNLNKNIRFLEAELSTTVSTKNYDWKTVSSGLLIQEKDCAQVEKFEVVSTKKPTDNQRESEFDVRLESILLRQE